MAGKRKFENDVELEDDFYDDLDGELFIEPEYTPRSPKRKTTKPKLTKRKRPEPWDDDWFDPADDLASDL